MISMVQVSSAARKTAQKRPCSTERFSLLESHLDEPKDTLERCGCLLYCIRSGRSNSTGTVLQSVSPSGCQFSPETGQQSLWIFYRSGLTELEVGPNTKNIPNGCA